MAFGIPTTIPEIPGLSTIASVASSGVSDAAKNAITDLTSFSRNVLFQNPMTDAIGLVTNSASTIQDKLGEIASGAVINPSISAGDATTFLAGATLSDLTAGLQAFTLHTDRLSGVLQGQGITVPGLEQVISVGKMMNTMTNLIDGAEGCLSIIGCSTAIFSQNEVSGFGNNLSSLVGRINNGIVTISEITDTVVNTKNAIAAIVNKDTNFLSQCVEQLKSASFGFLLESSMNDPCAKFIMERTGMPDFLTKLQSPPMPSIGGR